MSKKRKRKKQSDTRRRREMERIQKTAQEQSAAMPSSPSPSSETLPSPSLLEEPIASEEAEKEDLWTQFERAKPDDKQIIFQNALEAGELDDEYAFEMLSVIRSELDLGEQTARTRYAELVEQLRQQAPDPYHKSIEYYHENLIHDAIADGRWEALPELLTPFAEEAETTAETFSRIIDQLQYHGQIQPLIQAMSQGWSQMVQAKELFAWAIEEFGAQLTNLHLFNYLETIENPRADDSVLLEVTKTYNQWQEGWLERFIPRLTATTPSPWQSADFDESVDADQLHVNFNNLLAEFVADQHRSGIPYSRGYMAWMRLSRVINQQFSAPIPAPRPRGGGKRKKGKRRPARSKMPISPLVPRYQTMDKALVDLFPFMGAQPYKAAAIVELLPAYLHFLARLKLIHPKQMDQALVELKPLKTLTPRILDNYGADPHVIDAVRVAWSDEALDNLKNDPALADARATSPTLPPPSEKPTRRPNAIQTCTFKVTYLDNPDVWRTIEIAENQTLDDLHYAILSAVDFDTDHLYSFYMSGRAWDDSTEYASPHADGPSAAKVKIGDLNLRMKQRFMYLFDYGDEHQFEIQLTDINPDAPKKDYPQVVEIHGKNPVQYSGWEDAE
ncbi:MAG: plasmid pRiA4b ORF-3 family protein [Chloroflexi bacterium]|nr:plasmid pRiA4b ORF-3 family protein [Chloroflexota bacterium]